MICAISHECTIQHEPDPWKKNPVFGVDRVQVYITMEDTWSGWQDNGNIMDPGQNIHHIATSEVTDRQKTKFPSPGPHTWGYSTVWCFVLPATHTARAKVTSCLLFERSRVHWPSAAMLNERFRGFPQFPRNLLRCSLEQVNVLRKIRQETSAVIEIRFPQQSLRIIYY
jgi:hypothetical protein